MASHESSEEAVSSLLREECEHMSNTLLTPTLFPLSFSINYKNNKTDLVLRKGQGKINRPVLRKDEVNKTGLVFKVQNILKMEIREITPLLHVIFDTKSYKNGGLLPFNLRPICQ